MARFSQINSANSSDYNPRYQRHHLVPLQAARITAMNALPRSAILGVSDFDDFETNGVLLPCDEQEAMMTGRPLHRGPHPKYNELVIERLFLIARLGDRIDGTAERKRFLRFRTALLQSGLRRGLLANGFTKLCLNKRDPMRSQSSFDSVDARIDLLWAATKE